LKKLLISLIIIVLILLLSSSVLLYTDWFTSQSNAYEDKLPILLYLQEIQFISSLLLTSFIIAYANYSIKAFGINFKRRIIFYFGLFFAIVIITKLLSSYYIMTYLNKFNNIPIEIKAKNTILNASNLYYQYGLEIEYYHYDNTIKKFQPSEKDKQIRRLQEMADDKLYRIPIVIVISFLIMLIAYAMSEKLAMRKLTKLHNKNEEINSLF